MALHFIIGGSGSGKTTRLYRDLLREAKEHPERRFFAIVPEQSSMRTQREIVGMSPAHGIMNIDVLSFERLAYRVFDELCVPALAVLDDMGKSMVIRRISSCVRKDLSLFGSGLDRPGVIDGIKSQLSEFFQYDIHEEDLDRMMAGAESAALRKKLGDLRILMKAYREFTEGKAVSREEIPERLCRVLDRSEMVRGSVVTLDGFTGFTPVQYRVLEILLRICRDVTVTVTMDPAGSPYCEGPEQDLFRLGRHTVCRLIDIASRARVPHGEDILLTERPFPRFNKSRDLGFLETALFRHRAPSAEKAGDITLVCAATPSGEIRVIASEIRRLVMTKKIRYRDIGVIAGDLTAFRGEISHQFEENGIPFFMDDKKSILENPAAELVRASLEVIAENFSYESVFRCLKTGLLLPEDEGLFSLENYVLALGIRGFSRWNKAWDRTYRGAEQVNLDEINRLREATIAPFLTLRETFSKRGATVRERSEACVHFLQEIGLEEKLRARAAAAAKAGDEAGKKEYDQVYGLIMDLFDRICALLGDEKVSSKEYAEILDAGFSEIKIGLIPSTVDRVQVGDITRSRFGQIRVLFIAGANDGVIPQTAARSGVFSDMERAALLLKHAEIAPTAREEGFLQRFYLYLALTRPSEKLYLIYSAGSADGKEAAPSSLIGEIRKIFPGTPVYLPSGKNMAIWSPAAGLSEIARGLSDSDFVKNLVDGTADAQEKSAFLELYRRYAASDTYRDTAGKLVDAAFYVYRDTGIPKETAEDLYGKTLHGSVTRMENYAGCPYAHFLTFGLRLGERVEYELDMADLGNLFHTSLQKYFEKAGKLSADVTEISAEDREKIVNESVAETAGAYGNDIMASSARNQYLARRIAKTTGLMVEVVTGQLAAGDFRPAGVEVSFGPADRLKSMNIGLGEGEMASLNGRIDRLDVCEDGDDIYLRIIDYKTGRTRYDIGKIYCGLQLQLAVYMEAALEKYARLYPEKHIHPAGMYYCHIDDPLIERAPDLTADKVRELVFKKLRLNGAVNLGGRSLAHQDRIFGEMEDKKESLWIPASCQKGAVNRESNILSEEQFRIIGATARERIRTDGREILDGRISVRPSRDGDRTACDYCLYRNICGFDPSAGYSYHRFPKAKEDEIWQKMTEENGKSESAAKGEGDGSGMDG